MTIIAKHETPGSYAVTWACLECAHYRLVHIVTYGHSEKTFHDNLAASREFGECVRHAAECAGLFDEEDNK